MILKYITALMLGCLSVCCFYGGLSCYYNVNALLSVAEKAEATITSQTDGLAVLTWTAPDNVVRSNFYAVALLTPEEVDRGSVEILYDPGHLDYWKVNSFAGLRLWGLSINVMGLGLLILALFTWPNATTARNKIHGFHWRNFSLPGRRRLMQH